MRHLREDTTRPGGGISKPKNIQLSPGLQNPSAFAQRRPKPGPQAAELGSGLAVPERRDQGEPDGTKGLKSTRRGPAPTAHQNGGKKSREGRYYRTEGHPLLLCCFAVFQ